MKSACIIFLLLTLKSNAQIVTDSCKTNNGDSSLFSMTEVSPDKPSFRKVVIPLTFITYGFVALNSDYLHYVDKSMKNEIKEDNPVFHTTIDNYLQYSPALAVYGLNAVGVHGQNNFRDRTMIYLLSNAIMGVSVNSLKRITRLRRPDGGGHNAFPSGHTATAFVGAEFLRQEYKDVSPWYGVAGYAAATATGILRMYNNKHWFKDVVAGAGFGIISTRMAYWMYPVIKNKIFKNNSSTVVAPYYQDGGFGISLIHNF